MRRLSAFAVVAVLAGCAAPGAWSCGGGGVSSARRSSLAAEVVTRGSAPVLLAGVDTGDRFVGEDGKERGAGSFESHAVDFDRDAGRAAHDAR